jgi:hypothetical protein
MRAHVEVDATEAVGMNHIQVALRLREEWSGRCDIRLCCERSNLAETSSAIVI